MINPPGETPILIGFVALAIGSVLHFLVKGVLIRNSVVCKDGIYSVVRHPYYLANYIIDSAILVMTGNIYLVFIYPFLFFWAYGPTMKAEEKYLASVHVEQYALYLNTTPQVFPHSLCLAALKQIGNGFIRSRITPNELCRIGRFWGVSFLLALLQELRTDGFAVFHWTAIPKDWDVLVFMVLTVLLLAASLLSGRRSSLKLEV